jgi:hypothetical protein
VARQARQICRGTELIFAPGQRSKCGPTLVSQESGAHSGSSVVLFQTPAAGETADNGVKLSAEASHVAAGIRSASRSDCVRVQAPDIPAEVDLAGIQAERHASQRGQERINRQEPIKKPRRRRISRSASPLFRGVTTPDLPEGI